jgi:hypothetical protein
MVEYWKKALLGGTADRRPGVREGARPSRNIIPTFPYSTIPVKFRVTRPS